MVVVVVVVAVVRSLVDRAVDVGNLGVNRTVDLAQATFRAVDEDCTTNGSPVVTCTKECVTSVTGGAISGFLVATTGTATSLATSSVVTLRSYSQTKYK